MAASLSFACLTSAIPVFVSNDQNILAIPHMDRCLMSSVFRPASDRSRKVPGGFDPHFQFVHAFVLGPHKHTRETVFSCFMFLFTSVYPVEEDEAVAFDPLI